MFFFNTAFNPQDKDDIITHLDGDIVFSFSNEIGTEVNVGIGTYEVKTDTSMTPVIRQESRTGYYKATQHSNNFFIEQNGTGEVYGGFIGFSNEHKEIERKFGKYDDALSYVGGLFGLLMAFLGFFMMSFNEYRYELFVSEAFSFKSQHKVREENFHFLKYLKYVVYDWVKILCCCEPSWQDCEKVDAAREEANEQIDVQLLLRRIAHLEELNKTSVSLGQDLCTYLTEEQNIEEVVQAEDHPLLRQDSEGVLPLDHAQHQGHRDGGDGQHQEELALQRSRGG